MGLVRRSSQRDTDARAPVNLEGWHEDQADVAYAWLFRKEFAAVVRTAFLILHNRQEAEDVAQEAFTQLLVHWRKVGRYERPEAWVRRVAIRLAARRLRREQLRAILHRSVDPPVPTLPVDVDLLRALRALAPQQRAAVALFYLEDRPMAEIAQILGCSKATVKVHLFRARKRLAELLGEEHVDVP
jgi:DNA-directed RNA polymerase specialized sigma24 family protein